MRSLLGCLLSLSVVACDGPVGEPDGGAGQDASSSTLDGGRDAGSDDAGEGREDAGSDAGQPDDDGGADGGAEERRMGTMSVTQVSTSSYDTTGIAGAFLEAPVALGDDDFFQPCDTVAIQGACRVLSCPTGLTRVSAGTVTASVEGTEVVSLTQGASGDYGTFVSGFLFEAGDEIAFAASGDIVPAFSGAVVGPGAPTLSVPATIPRDAPLTVDFTASAERVQLVLGAGTSTIFCLVDAAEGSVTVAPELLATMPADDASLGLTAFNTTVVSAGDYDIALTAGEARGGPTRLE